MTDQYQWVKTDAELAQAAKYWSGAQAIAIDTEFVRTETFHAYLGLIQIGIAEQTWLVDPLEISQWQPLADVLADPNTVKILHSLSEDAEVINHHLGVLMNNVFDTQIAAGFLGRPVQMSYAKLVEDLFDVVLPKEETRSDWLKRPLTDQQCFYAAADVHWLFQVYHIFSAELQKTGRYEWVAEDSQKVVSNNLPVAPEDYYQKLRGGWKLKKNRLKALQDLCAWRENLARSTNVNRGRILNDKELILIAEKMLSTKTELQEVAGLHSRKIRLYGDEVITIVSRAKDDNTNRWPSPVVAPLPTEQASLFKEIKALISELAEKFDVPFELLAKRKGIEAWLRSGYRDGQYLMPDVFDGWRAAILKEPISKALATHWEKQNEA